LVLLARSLGAAGFPFRGLRGEQGQMRFPNELTYEEVKIIDKDFWLSEEEYEKIGI